MGFQSGYIILASGKGETHIIKTSRHQEISMLVVSRASPEVANLLGPDVGWAEWRIRKRWRGNLKDWQRRSVGCKRHSDAGDRGDQRRQTDIERTPILDLGLGRAGEHHSCQLGQRDCSLVGDHGRSMYVDQLFKPACGLAPAFQVRQIEQVLQLYINSSYLFFFLAFAWVATLVIVMLVTRISRHSQPG